MLITPKYTINDVVTIKMVGGDEIIGKLVDINKGTDLISYTVNYPHVVMMAQQGFGMMPYVLTAEPKSDIVIDARHVITISKTQSAVMKAYFKQTTGLAV